MILMIIIKIELDLSSYVFNLWDRRSCYHAGQAYENYMWSVYICSNAL